ncbi:glutamate racemase [Candidatus Pantoea edessiphila]|uniref:Glutamate racemase n=1 Tax=Candidatus Pantoea edessiphila TaxID=2044610 RepID=A0A2P5T0A9_9GAMM|nr:glutamate racemase [Candidatus Pantoea edessiphila]PPI88017.1 glutamate racemase [Candidatus Pantoea edessiphila]
MNNPNYKPIILIFDSGIGGLSVYNEIKKQFPNIHYIYIFDNAGFPYGNKEQLFIIKRIINIFEKIVSIFSISLAIIACNTASIISLFELRKRYVFPIIGLVPAIKPSVKITKNGIIGLLATHNTITSMYVNKLIYKFAKNCIILKIQSSKLVYLAEEKFIGKKIFLKDLQYVINPWLKQSQKPDTVILGCTHFVLLRDELQKVLPSNTYLIDSNIAIANRVSYLLKYTLIKIGYLKENIAFCTCINSKSIQISLTLKKYGFPILQELKFTEIINLN